MIEKIIRWCIQHTKMVVGLALVLGVWGAYCLKNITVDAIPDLSETQVIIFSEWMGRSPDLIEDQVTYPLISAMVSAPQVKVVRGQSMFGMSFVYVIFEEGTDLYWARSRVLEYLSKLTSKLPSGVTPTIGPDATGVGWIFQYSLIDRTGQLDMAQIKSFQDWHLRYWLGSVPGVAEVASVGGFDKQYQIEVDPNKLAALNISLQKVIQAVRNSNANVGGKTLEISEREYYIRGLGYVKNTLDLEDVSLGLSPDGIPIRVKDVGRVHLGPNIRRGIADVDGRGDTVVGVVVMRQGEDAARVIGRLKQKIEEVKPAFPHGLELKPIYDRSIVIRESLQTLASSVIEEILIVLLVILLFLFHMRSILVVMITLPLSVLATFIPMYYFGISLNIMSMGGIILAAGDIVDGIVIFIENMHKKLALTDAPGKSRSSLTIEACSELAPSIFSALLIIAISFLPIFSLQAQEGKLFHPLAYTKTFAMISAALITVTLTPPLIFIFVRGKIRSEAQNPFNHWMAALYRPCLAFCVRRFYSVLMATLIAMGLAGFAFSRLGSEFMPPLWEGDLLYMPITVPGISITAASDLLTRQTQAIRNVPEVESVFGKAGRFDSATDPAPLSMFEYSIHLKARAQWTKGLSDEDLIAKLDQAVAVPGLNRAWTKPIRGRIDMLSTGIRTPLGIKIFGQDSAVIENLGQQIEAVLSKVKGTLSVYAERIGSGYYLDFEPDRSILQRYGLTIADVQMVIETAIGGMEISQTVEGRERYNISVRYPRELRDDTEKLGRILVATPTGAQIPLAQLGRLNMHMGPPMILDENASLVGYVYIDLKNRDPGGYVSDAKAALAQHLKLPPGYFLSWTGQYENLERMQARMAIVLPLTLLLIFICLYVAMRSVPKTLLVMVSVPLSLVGGVFLMWALNYNMSVAVWAGIIALVGVAVETAAIMVAFLDQSWIQMRGGQQIRSDQDYITATLDGAQKSLRPVLMAVSMNIFGLLPVMMATGIGADVMKRISSPMFGGLFSLLLLTLLVIPVIYHRMSKYEKS